MIESASPVRLAAFTKRCPWCHEEINGESISYMRDHAKYCPFFSELVSQLKFDLKAMFR